jgi:apolipoprotein N-acyltransferase
MQGPLKIFLAAASGAALAMCFTPFDQDWLVWGWMWVLFPLLWTVNEKRRRLRAFGLAWIAGMAFWLINLKWLGSLTWPGTIALSAYLSVYFGIFGAFAASSANPWRKEYLSAKTIPARLRQMGASLGYAALLGGFWCGLEWVRTWLMTGFGWNGLGVTFANSLILAQNAEYVGVIGLSFLPVFFSAVVVQTARRFYRQFHAGEVKMLHWDFAAALLVIMIAFTVGTTRLSSVTNAPKIEGRVLLMQQNIPQVAGQVLWESQRIVDGFLELTEQGLEAVEREAAEALQDTADEEELVTMKSPHLVVWPEACLPDFLKLQEDGSTRGGPGIESIFDYVNGLGDFTFVTGVNEFTGDSPMDPEAAVYNSFISDNGEGKRESYQKHHLVILGEFMPELPFLRKLYYDTAGVEFGNGITRGESFEPLTLQLGDHEIGMIPSICFEDTVQRVTRKFVRNEPQLLVNITNDGWFGESEGAAQHFRNALFRTIELRRPMVRSSNRGITGVVSAAGSLTDPYTKEKRHLVDEKGSHFHRGYLLASVYVPTEGKVTLYAAYGDWFAATGLGVGFLWMVFQGVRTRLTRN